MMTFSEKVYYLRKQRNLTQEQLAKLANVTQSAIQGYETGRFKPHRNTAAQLAKVLKVSVTDLTDDERSV